MTALDPDITKERLAKLEEVVEKLERERPSSAKELAKSDLLSDATLYRLQVGIEAIVDIGGHILAEVFHQRTESYKDTIRELARVGIIPADFAEQNLPMTDFRNLVVHHYGTIDLAKVYDYLTEAPDIFRQFAGYYHAFMEKQKAQ
ncbi:MAG: hypothetical protein COT71_02345 [Candidatus Andersenbacteria bacterium CG10_big_fil_rev_8_21_14_0_10_54_11]|uniref:DUF86 domain-containing protein n=1 Tax=Candidatus Andersenbacteria bacterium CG10_big_fil_rev_8_21_14_0_10_54_11 TaxID=1974485 RepID=A0A2M6WZF0_9BACT|nr:MAG: hypothetical protein COT71_02345 [Candidatus Andersenbacteria bacterium CG10_big_fil_rev_8_21_14_0_10_54_11]